MDTLFPDLPTAVHHDEARLRAVVPPRHDDAPETLTRGGERGRIDPARADAFLEGLTPAQREAVLHAGSPLLIVAGAGSGKTRRPRRSAAATRRAARPRAARGSGPRGTRPRARGRCGRARPRA